eukprot:1041406-Alexandrium_andersonii.AAC.1
MELAHEEADEPRPNVVKLVRGPVHPRRRPAAAEDRGLDRGQGERRVCQRRNGPVPVGVQRGGRGLT